MYMNQALFMLDPNKFGYEDFATMKKSLKTMLGVTLLEIMLVLAIAAMVIVMSIRYYQSANASQQVNAAASMMTAIVAAADGLAQATGSYAAGGVTTATITPLLPNGSNTLPWGGTATIETATATTVPVKFNKTPANVCPLLKAKYSGTGSDPHFTSSSTCNTSGTTDLTITYNSNP
jgi:type II secretory pathway pseudopilin PulG